MRLLLVFSLLVAVVSSYKFFVYIPLFGHSHVTFLTKIAETLAEAGHDVTVVLPIMEPLLTNKTSFKLVKKIHMIENDERVERMMEESRGEMFAKLWTLSPTPTGMLQMANNMSRMMAYSCDKVINEDALLEKLKKEKFDVGISEPFNFCGFGIMEHLGIKTTLGAFSGVNLDVISRHIGEPSAYSYVPTMMSLTDKMGLFKRLGNAFGGAVGFWMFNNIAIAEGEYMKKKWGDSFSGHEKLLGDMSFSFVNANPYMDFPRPLLHKTVQIGGITVDQKNPGKLDEKWDKVLSERKKTVFISFGSVAKSKDMPESYKQQILKMCASMPDVTFIWKYEEPSTMADHLPNVHLSPWLPQKALLADDRLNLFITHGGLGSTTEVAYLGKPAVFIPLFAEQPRNAAMLQRHGTAVVLHKEDLADAENVKSAINKVLHDPTYSQNAKKLADLLNNQPIPAKQLMLSHAEFAAKYGPLNLLTPTGKDLSFIEYYLLDAAALVFTVLALLISLPVLICKKFCRSSSGKKQKKE